MTLTRILIAAVAVGALLIGARELSAQPTDAVSREVSVFNGEMMPPVVYTDAVSREISVFNGPPMPPIEFTDAVSREFTVYNGPLAPPLVFGDAVSREMSVENIFLCKGNMTDDGLVLMNDIPQFVSVLIGQITDPFLHQAADMNCDGSANGADIQPFVDCLLGDACP